MSIVWSSRIYGVQVLFATVECMDFKLKLRAVEYVFMSLSIVWSISLVWGAEYMELNT